MMVPSMSKRKPSKVTSTGGAEYSMVFCWMLPILNCCGGLDPWELGSTVLGEVGEDGW